MIKLSSDLSLLRNRKTEVKKEPLESSFFSSRSFAAQGVTAMLLKTAVPLFYIMSMQWEANVPFDLLSFNFLIYILYLTSSFLILLMGRFSKKTPQPLSMKVVLQCKKTYFYLYSVGLAFLLPPSCMPEILFALKSLVIILETLFLYNYLTCDEYFKLEYYAGNGKMKLYECYEENHGTKKLTILGSTNTCITMKNVGYEDLDVNFVIDRQTYYYREYHEDHLESTDNKYSFVYDFIPERDFEFTQRCRAEGCKVPPGKVFKIVTTEYDVEDLKEDELCFVVPEYRVFGTNIDNYVVTTVNFDKNATSPFDVRLTQKYETKKEKAMRKKHEKNLPAVVYRDIPKKMKKVKKAIKKEE